jgi:hypothetical protein
LVYGRVIAGAAGAGAALKFYPRSRNCIKMMQLRNTAVDQQGPSFFSSVTYLVRIFAGNCKWRLKTLKGTFLRKRV